MNNPPDFALLSGPNLSNKQYIFVKDDNFDGKLSVLNCSKRKPDMDDGYLNAKIILSDKRFIPNTKFDGLRVKIRKPRPATEYSITKNDTIDGLHLPDGIFSSYEPALLILKTKKDVDYQFHQNKVYVKLYYVFKDEDKTINHDEAMDKDKIIKKDKVVTEIKKDITFINYDTIECIIPINKCQGFSYQVCDSYSSDEELPSDIEEISSDIEPSDNNDFINYRQDVDKLNINKQLHLISPRYIDVPKIKKITYNNSTKTYRILLDETDNTDLIDNIQIINTNVELDKNTPKQISFVGEFTELIKIHIKGMNSDEWATWKGTITQES